MLPGFAGASRAVAFQPEAQQNRQGHQPSYGQQRGAITGRGPLPRGGKPAQRGGPGDAADAQAQRQQALTGAALRLGRLTDHHVTQRRAQQCRQPDADEGAGEIKGPGGQRRQPEHQQAAHHQRQTRLDDLFRASIR